MGKTYRADSKESKMVHDGVKTSTYYRRESKEVRIHHARDVRRETKHALRDGEFELLPNYPHTSGWETH